MVQRAPKRFAQETNSGRGSTIDTGVEAPERAEGTFLMLDSKGLGKALRQMFPVAEKKTAKVRFCSLMLSSEFPTIVVDVP